MSEFVGRTGAQRVYSYPEANLRNLSFARNFALGPAQLTPIPDGAGVQIPWSSIESGAPAGPSVPITPRVTARVLVFGTVTIKNVLLPSTPVLVSLQVELDGIAFPVPANEQDTIDGLGAGVLSFLTLIPNIPVGTTHFIQVRVTASTPDALILGAESSMIEIQEMQAATG